MRRDCFVPVGNSGVNSGDVGVSTGVRCETAKENLFRQIGEFSTEFAMLFGAVFLFWMGRCRCRESPQKRWDCFVKKDSRKAVLFSAEVMIRTLAISTLSGQPFWQGVG